MKPNFKIVFLFFFVLRFFFANAQEKKDILTLGNIGFYIEPAMSSGVGSPMLFSQNNPAYGTSYGGTYYSNPKPNTLAAVYGFGMDISVLKRKRMNLGTGLSYTIYKYNGMSDQYSFHYEPTDPAYANPKTIVTDIDCKSCALFHYETKFINIPISAQYYFGIKNARAFFIDAAIIGSWRVYNAIPSWWYSGESPNKYLFSSIGIGFNQRFGSTNLFVEPIFNYQIIPVYGFRYYSVGLKTGIAPNFKFSKQKNSSDTTKHEKIKNRFSVIATTGGSSIGKIAWLSMPGISKKPGGFIRLTGSYRAGKIVSFISGITYRHFVLPAEYILYSAKLYSYNRTVQMLMFPFWISLQSTLSKKLNVNFYGGMEYSYVKATTTGENYTWGWGLEHTKPISKEIWFATAGLYITYNINPNMSLFITASASSQASKHALKNYNSLLSFTEYGLGINYRFIKK